MLACRRWLALRRCLQAHSIPTLGISIVMYEQMSADTDFARFGEVRWENPLAGG